MSARRRSGAVRPPATGRPGAAARPGATGDALLHGLPSLALRCALGVLATGALSVIVLIIGWPPPVALLILIALVIAAITWVLHEGIDRAPPVILPRRDLDPEALSPDAGDTRVRRLEDAIHGAQPRHGMTTDVLAARLAEAVEARGPVDPERLSPTLRALLDSRPTGQSAPRRRATPTVDRATLHRLLREIDALDPLAAGAPDPQRTDPPTPGAPS